MPRKTEPAADNPEEFKRFIDLAREVEADESPDALDRAFRRIIPVPTPRPDASPGPAAKKRPGSQAKT